MTCKHISKPWLDYIISNKKIFEGRVNKGFWKDLKIGDTFTFSDDAKHIDVIVTSLKYFRDFGDAWFILQDKLIPTEIYDVISMTDARNIYDQYFSREEINHFGVVAVGLNLICK